jgi:hypothetical protein
MRIECKTTFLDGPERFEAGDVRTVDDLRAHRFIAHGWAAEVGRDAVPQAEGAVALDIKNARMGQGVKHG